MTVSSLSPTLTSKAAAAASSSSAAASSSSATTSSGSTLNQADFLQLLVAQMKYQDPTNPQSDTDMAAQLAQFTSLQQTTQSSSSLAMLQANSLVGSTVTVQVDTNDSASGVVSGVVLSNGTPQITINGANYSLNQVTSITPAAASGGSGATASQTKQ